jgi:hypothetical protein
VLFTLKLRALAEVLKPDLLRLNIQKPIIPQSKMINPKASGKT